MTKWFKKLIGLEDAPIWAKILFFICFLVGFQLTSENLVDKCKPLVEYIQSRAAYDPGPQMLFSVYLHVIKWFDPSHIVGVFDVVTWEKLMVAVLSLTLLLPRVPLLVTAGGQFCLFFVWMIFQELCDYGHAIEAWGVILCTMLVIQAIYWKGRRWDYFALVIFCLELGFMPLMRESSIVLVVFPVLMVSGAGGLMALSNFYLNHQKKISSDVSVSQVKPKGRNQARQVVTVPFLSRPDWSYVRWIVPFLIFFMGALVVQQSGLKIWTIKTGKPFLPHGSGYPLYLSLGFVSNPYNIVWDDDCALVQSLLIDKVVRDPLNFNDQKRLKDLWMQRLLEDPLVLEKGVMAKGAYLLRIFSGFVDPRVIQSDLGPMGRSWGLTLLLAAFCLCLGIWGRILFRIQTDRHLILMAGTLGIMVAGILPLLIIVPFYFGSAIAALLSFLFMLTPALVTIDSNSNQAPPDIHTTRNRLVYKIVLVLSVSLSVIAGVFGLYRLAINRTEAKALLQGDPLFKFAMLGPEFSDRFNRLAVEDQEIIVKKILSSGGHPTIFLADPRESDSKKIFQPVFALVGDRMVAVVARMSREWSLILPSRVQGPRNSVLMVLKNSDVGPRVLPYGGYPLNFQKITDGSWDGRYRMFCLPQQMNMDADAQYFYASALNFRGGSHARGLILEEISGGRLIRSDLIRH